MADAAIPAATTAEKTAWVLVAAALLFVFWTHLVPALVAGLLVNVLLHRMARRMAGPRLSHGRAKLLAAALAGLVAVGITAGVILTLFGFARGHVGDLPALIQRMAEVLDETALWLGRHAGSAVVPDALRDAEQLKDAVSEWLRVHGAELRKTGGEVGRGLLHAGIGIAVGLLIFFRRPVSGAGPLGRALAERLRRIGQAFEAVVFAQVRISAVNTVLTAIYLFVVLRLAGVHLPMSGTLVAVTFLTGLVPVVGNLVSNTAIVVISLGSSVWVAVSSLVFLVAIHKLEYFVNARIVGARIHAAAWEILVAILVFESAFGVPGLVLAPILYAYVKQELVDRGLV